LDTVAFLIYFKIQNKTFLKESTASFFRHYLKQSNGIRNGIQDGQPFPFYFLFLRSVHVFLFSH